MGGGAREIHAIEIPLVHVQQHLSWDCGVSAVMMVLNCCMFQQFKDIEQSLIEVMAALSSRQKYWSLGKITKLRQLEKDRKYLQNNLDLVSKEEGFNKSTWTIDLAYLLHKFGVRHLYATVTLGVNPGYTEEDFYLQVLKKDAQRINEKFLTANLHDVKVEKRSVEMEEILDHLGAGNPAIVLVNANLLFCDTCHTKKCLMKMLSCCNSNFSYQGHYIVLCGFDKRENKILYRNPSVLNKVCSMPYESFESARKSFGTDEDVLFVYICS